MGNFVVDFVAGFSLLVPTTEIVEKKPQKLTTNQNNWIFDNLQLITI